MAIFNPTDPLVEIGVTRFKREKPGGAGFQPANDDRLKTCPTRKTLANCVRPKVKEQIR
jgi:hypothetical protein